MLIQTDPVALLRSLGVYTFDPDIPSELAGKLQALQGTAVDRIFTSTEMLYAFREQLDPDGLTLLGQLTGFIQAQNWDSPHEPGRYVAIHHGVLRDLEGAIFEDEDPEPQVLYREDTADWRDLVEPNLDQLKTAKRRAVNKLKDEKQNGPAPTPFGYVDGDDSSKIKLNGAVTMAMLAAQQQVAFSVDWTMADNSVLTLDGLETMQMGQAAGHYVSLVHNHARDLKAQIDAVTVIDGDIEAAVAELNAIDIAAGWPT